MVGSGGFAFGVVSAVSGVSYSQVLTDVLITFLTVIVTLLFGGDISQVLGNVTADEFTFFGAA